MRWLANVKKYYKSQDTVVAHYLRGTEHQQRGLILFPFPILKNLCAHKKVKKKKKAHIGLRTEQAGHHLLPARLRISPLLLLCSHTGQESKGLECHTVFRKACL